MTDSDLWEARQAVDERIETRSRRRGPRIVLTAAVAVVALVALGITAFLTLGADEEAAQFADPPASIGDPDDDFLTGQAATPQLVTGVWRVDNGETMLRFGTDGTVQFDDQGTLFSRPGTTGTYVVSGGAITVTTTAAGDPSCVGTTSRIRASFPEPGSMRLGRSSTPGACSPMPVGSRVLEKVLPTSRSLAGLRFSTDSGWTPLADASALHGVWLAEGGGHVLEMNAAGAYVLVDDSGVPIDKGRWSFGNHALTLTSSSESATCSSGDRLVLGSVLTENPGTTAIRGTTRQNACGGRWTPAAWLLFPNAAG